jgi:hypothetical protein
MLAALLLGLLCAPPSPPPSEPSQPRLPRPADPWSLLRDTPGVVIDRVSVGGSETGQQALVLSHGDPGTGVTWTLDGVEVTDPAALGSTSIYPDMDALSRVDVQTTALDVRVRTPGVHVALTTRRPAARRQGAAHLRGGGFLQGDNLPSALSGRPFFRNRTNAVWEMGGELGGPVRGERLWLWGAASRSALWQDTFTEHEERLRTTSFMGRARLRLAGGFLSLLGVRAEKLHDDRDPTFTAAPEARLRQSGPTTLVALTDERPWGAVQITSRVSLMDAGFRLEPQGGEQDAYEDLRGVYQRSYSRFETSRPRVEARFEGTGARDAWGFAHQALLGVGYRRSTVETRSGWPAGGVLALERQDVFFRAFHLTGFALPTREQESRSRQEGFEVYAQDTLRRGRLAFRLGLRLDALSGRNLPSSVSASRTFPDLLPAASYGGGGVNVRWLDLLPRVAVSWDAAGDGTTTSRLSYAAYGAALGSGEVTSDNPLAQSASLTYYWIDHNGDHTVQPGELDLTRGRPGVSGIDLDRPGVVESPHVIDPELRSPRTHELAVSAEHVVGPRLKVRFQAAGRRLRDPLWRPLRNLTLADYVIRGAVQGRLLAEDYSVGYYAPASASRIVKGNGRRLANREGYHQDAVTATLELGGRLAGSLRWQASGSIMSWRERFTDRALAVQDPTQTESSPLIDNGMVAARASGLGRADVFVNARWTAGAQVSSRLPWGFRSAVVVHARDGFPIPYYQMANTGDPSAGAKNVLVSPELDRYRLPTLALVDARLERDLPWRGRRITLGLEAFNLLDASTTLQVARDVDLPAFARPRELVRPRLLRLAVDYRF